MSAPFEHSQVLDRIPGIRHGFFGREGGRSTGDFASQQHVDQQSATSPTSSSPTAPAPPMRWAATASPTSSSSARSIRPRVVTLTERPDRGVASKPTPWSPTAPDLLLGILTADCAPILLADPEAGSSAPPMPAGRAPPAASSATPSRPWSRSAPSPSASSPPSAPPSRGANYEVGPEFAAQICSRSIATPPRHISDPGRRPASISTCPASSVDQLIEAGVGLVNDLGLCTYANPSAISRTATPPTRARRPAGRSRSSGCA